MSRIVYILLAVMLVSGAAAAQETGLTSPFSSAMVADLLPADETASGRGTPIEAPEAESSSAHKTPPSAVHEAVVLTEHRPVLTLLETAETSISLKQAQLQMFSGARFGEMIALHWVTTSEAGTVGFEIERRSQLSADWKVVGYSRRSRSATSQHTYSFLDQLRGDGVSYYRLRQIGMDGGTTVSPVITVTPDDVPHSFSVWKHSIQPFQNYSTVAFGLDHETSVTLSLVDRFGSTVSTMLKDVRMAAGHHVIPFGTYMLNSGFYILRISSEDGIQHLLLMNS